MNEKLKVEGAFTKTINFAMQQNYVPVLRSLKFTNLSDQKLENLILKISFEPEFAREFQANIETLEAGASVELSPVRIRLSPDYLLGLTEKMVGNITVEVFEGQERIYSFEDFIELLAYDEWAGLLIMPEIIAAFVTPNHPKIAQILAKASIYLNKWSGSPSFTGYQTRNPNVVKMEMAAVYAALQEENIAYMMPPASYENAGQRVRMAPTVLEQKQGTCLDLSILYASCLEAAGLNGILIFVKGHAFAGCWLEEETFADCALDDISALTKRMAAGITELAAVECTDFVAGKGVPFDLAEKHAMNHLLQEDEFEYAVDIARSRGSGIRPVPLRSDGNGGFMAADYGYRKEDEITGAPAPIDNTGRVTVQEGKVELTKQKLWERKLLDLSLRNTLLNFRITKNAIQLMTANLGKLEDEMAKGGEFIIKECPKEWSISPRDPRMFEVENEKDLVETIAESEFKSRRIRTFLPAVELEGNLKSLHRNAKVSLEENGTNTLYIALGFLKWYESDVSERARYAPLVLVPVEVVRKVRDRSFAVRIRGEEPQMNITLLEMLRQDFGLLIGGLDPLPQDENGVALPLVFNVIRQCIMARKRWDVCETAFLGLFSFSQFIMWNDIRNRSEELAANKVVASLISGKLKWEPLTDCVKAEELDEKVAPSDMAVPASADSSQLEAICAAAKGESFVLHGPPGTGKSQTITNMIANALYQGKSVLFVAEKMAALTVVQKRLAKIGLEPFCLELHSNKANKKSVLNQLERSLEAGRVKAPEDYLRTADELHQLRKDLNYIVDALHEKRAWGSSLYEAVSVYEKNRPNADKIKFPAKIPEAATPESVKKWRILLDKYRIAWLEAGDCREHSFLLYGGRAYTPKLRESFREKILAMRDVLDKLEAEYKQLTAKMCLRIQPSREAFEKLSRLLGIVQNPAPVLPALLADLNDTAGPAAYLNTLACGREKDTLEKALLDKFENSILQYDAAAAKLRWKQAEASWFLPKALNQKKLIKEMRLYAKNPETVTGDSLAGIYEQLEAYHQKQTALSQADPIMRNMAGNLWMGANSSWDILEQAMQKSEALRGIFRDYRRSGIRIDEAAVARCLTDGSCEERMLQETIPAFQNHLSDCNKLEESFKNDHGICIEELQSEENYPLALQKLLNQWEENITDLKSWILFLQSEDAVKEAGLSCAADAVRAGTVNPENLISAFEGGLMLRLAMDTIDKDSRLAAFQGIQYEDSIEKYGKCLNKFEQLTIQELAARLSARIPVAGSSAAGSSEMGILQKAIKSNGRMLSIRKLFESIPELLRRLCPCMLMSPISVAQYIDPSYPKFDLVIFDEASQLPTSEAVGAIARGENAVIVGDPKQLPPTSFFAGNHSDEENYEREDLESLLDDCLALSMPQKHLLWHYRSRHESLIAYSNMQYYDNKLFTFPSPNDLKSEVSLVRVEGFYDKGKTKQNRAEAEAVVAEIIRRLRDEELRKNSIGVVTFSAVQQNLIDDLLVEEFRKYPELEQIDSAGTEPVFIKNLENVQGDERDVILFSVGYGPDKDGKVSMNFGPLNREGGWRRLNVAISRARRQMIVYAAIRPEQIDLNRTRSAGVAGLKGFLEFAEKGSNVLVAKQGMLKPQNNILEEQLAQAIREMGYQVKCNIGCSAYKIDLGVVHPEHPDTYTLGIMLDGDHYKEANTSRDRNILQPGVLKGLGWKLVHIWTLDWLDNPDKVKAALKQAIEESLKEEFPVPDPKIPKTGPVFEKITVKELESKRKKDYSAVLLMAQGRPEDFYLTQNRAVIRECIKAVLEREAPVSHRILVKRVLNAWGITRSGNKVEAILSDEIQKLGAVRTEGNGSCFYWAPGMEPEQFAVYRVAVNDESRRTMDDICPEEIANAVCEVLEQQISLTYADLVRETAKKFGFTRMGTVIDNAVSAGIETAKVHKRLTVDQNRITLLDAVSE